MASSSRCLSFGPMYDDFPSAMEVRRRTCGPAAVAARHRLIPADAAVWWFAEDLVVIFNLYEELLVTGWAY